MSNIHIIQGPAGSGKTTHLESVAAKCREDGVTFIGPVQAQQLSRVLPQILAGEFDVVLIDEYEPSTATVSQLRAFEAVKSSPAKEVFIACMGELSAWSTI